MVVASARWALTLPGKGKPIEARARNKQAKKNPAEPVNLVIRFFRQRPSLLRQTVPPSAVSWSGANRSASFAFNLRMGSSYQYSYNESMPKAADSGAIKEILERGVDTIYPSRAALEQRLKSGDKLTLYLGVDPSGEDLHIGH